MTLIKTYLTLCDSDETYLTVCDADETYLTICVADETHLTVCDDSKTDLSVRHRCNILSTDVNDSLTLCEVDALTPALVLLLSATQPDDCHTPRQMD